MARARRHQRLLSVLAFGLIALAAELLGRSLTHRLDFGRHVATPSYSGTDYYPILLGVVKTGIAHVPEGRRLFAGLTVRENLQVGAYARGGKADIERAVGLFPRLGERLDQVAGSMSGGEQQMCAIARGLMADPKLIMIDELSLGLAPNLVEQILERLTSVTEAGTAVLLVEQDVDAALETAARGYVLENGRIVAAGESASLLDDPRIREAYLGVT